MSQRGEMIAKSADSFTLTILGIVFITLKLLGKIDWSWWYVTMPFWAPVALLAVVFLGGAVLIGSKMIIKEFQK